MNCEKNTIFPENSVLWAVTPSLSMVISAVNLDLVYVVHLHSFVQGVREKNKKNLCALVTQWAVIGRLENVQPI